MRNLSKQIMYHFEEMKKISLGFVSGAGFSGLCAVGYAKWTDDKEKKNRLKHGRFGLPIKSTGTLTYANHALQYDESKRIPLWVSEHITEKKVTDCSECITLNKELGLCGTGKAADRSKCQFQPDPTIPTVYSASNGDYRRSGWSRGHLAPAGDNKYSQEAMNDTFYLSNIVPQDMKNNGGYWNMMEMYCRELTKRFPDVYITSGSLFLPTETDDHGRHFVKYQVIGENRVAVPTHLYKVIAVDRGRKNPLVAAFVVPNARIPLDKDLKDFQITIEELEKLSGFQFLPNLPPSNRMNLCEVAGECRLEDKDDFLAFIYGRSLRQSRTKPYLRKQWEKVRRDGLDGRAALRTAFENRLREIEEKEAGRNDPTTINPDIQSNPAPKSRDDSNNISKDKPRSTADGA